MQNFIATRLNPHWYHGHGKQAPFFEGWYYKLVTADEQNAFAFIPGVFIALPPAKTHSFIQVLDGTRGKATYHSYETFYAKPNAFDVRITNNHFTQDGFRLNIADEVGRIEGEIRLEGLTPMPIYPLSPGIMGYFGWLPFLECNHGIISFNHRLRGILNIYGQTVDFDGGKGYLEKDWGTNFPRGYIWMQTNHFDTESTSLSASIAVIPNLGRAFPGFIVALHHEGTLYRFATYNGAKVDTLRVDEDAVRWTLYNRTHELVLHATRAEGATLRSPERTEMQKRVEETMRATVHVQLNRLEGFRKFPVYEGTGRNAGLEVVGDLRMLLK